MAWASRGSMALGTLTSDVWDPELSGRVCCFLGILVALAGWWGGAHWEPGVLALGYAEGRCSALLMAQPCVDGVRGPVCCTQ